MLPSLDLRVFWTFLQASGDSECKDKKTARWSGLSMRGVQIAMSLNSVLKPGESAAPPAAGLGAGFFASYGVIPLFEKGMGWNVVDPDVVHDLLFRQFADSVDFQKSAVGIVDLKSRYDDAVSRMRIRTQSSNKRRIALHASLERSTLSGACSIVSSRLRVRRKSPSSAVPAMLRDLPVTVFGVQS